MSIPINSFSEELKAVLLYAVSNESSDVMFVLTKSGLSVSVGRQNLFDSKDERGIARWLECKSRLLDLGLAEDQGVTGDVLRVTEKGFKTATRVMDSQHASKDLPVSNIEVFNIVTIEVLSKCKEQFPSTCSFDDESLISSINACLSKEDAISLKNSRVKILISDSMDQLVDLGCIRIKHPNDTFPYGGTTLTEKGMSIMSAKPDSLKNTGSIGESLSKLTKAFATSGAALVVKEIIKALS